MLKYPIFSKFFDFRPGNWGKSFFIVNAFWNCFSFQKVFNFDWNKAASLRIKIPIRVLVKFSAKLILQNRLSDFVWALVEVASFENFYCALAMFEAKSVEAFSKQFWRIRSRRKTSWNGFCDFFVVGFFVIAEYFAGSWIIEIMEDNWKKRFEL